jgi:Ni,Fe-hydrogenase III component G
MKKSEKDEIAKIVNDELKKFVKDELDKEMKDILHKSTSKSHKEITDIIKDALEAAFKVLWVKKDFWKKDIK